MSNIEVNIEVDNAAFRNPDNSINTEEIKRVFAQVIRLISVGSHCNEGLKDINGNYCGTYYYFDDDLNNDD